MTAKGLRYYINLYVNLRIIRHHHRCTLPIEVFYNGPDDLPGFAIDYIKLNFRRVTFVDLSLIPHLPDNLHLQGYTFKPFAMLLSSFEEILFLDVDSYPFADPTAFFNFKFYKQSGSVFWQDFCNFYSANKQAWEVLGLPKPPAWPDMEAGKIDTQGSQCNPLEPSEVEAGQILINKRISWKGLVMTAFIVKNHAFFLRHVINTDKNTYQFGYNATNTPFHMVHFNPLGIGRQSMPDLTHPQGVFCSSAFGHRHPQNGSLIIIHRGLAKLDRPGLYFDPQSETPRVFEFVGLQGPKSTWEAVWNSRADVPAASLLLPGPLATMCMRSFAQVFETECSQIHQCRTDWR